MVTSSQSKLLTTFSTETTTVVNLATSYPLLSTTRNSLDELPKDCSGINFDNAKHRSYIVYPYGIANTSVPVYCEFAEDGIWTVIQKRIDGSVDFYRDWIEYKEGFGDVSGEHWVGNDVIHQLTSQSQYALKVILTDWDNVTKYALFTTFSISDETDDYRLSIAVYSGDAVIRWFGIIMAMSSVLKTETMISTAL